VRIAQVIDYFHTDVGYQEFYLAKSQAEAGHDVVVISSTLRHHTVARPGLDEQSGLHQLQTAGVEIVRLPAKQFGHDRAWLRGLEAQLSAFGPDVIHCHGPFAPTAVRVARWCRQARVPVLVDNHINDAIAPGASTVTGRAFYAAYQLSFGRLLRSTVGAWVAIGPYEADFLERHLDVPADRVAIIPLGFEPFVFHYDAERRQRLRRDHGWDGDVVVAVTGKLHPGKRVEAVAAACERVGAPVRLAIAGSIEPGYLDLVRGSAPELDSVGRVQVMPMLPRDALADLYLASDVVAFARLPSISIYEAAGTGARVVVGRDRFGDWLNGMHDGIESVPPDEFDEHLRPERDRAESARQAAETFSWNVVSNAFVRRYEAMV
jgi:glycosyltransferase involved in cell wall biosynthesis